MHVPYCICGFMCLSTARRALGSCVPVLLLGYAQSFLVAPRRVSWIQWELTHLPLAWQMNHLYGHLVPWELSMGAALASSPSPLQLGCPSCAGEEVTGCGG